MATLTKFTVYKWSGLNDVAEGTEGHGRVKTFIESINWDALCQYASKLRNGESCTIDPDIDMGGVHMIRIITFSDGTRWIARLRTRFFNNDDDNERDVALVSFMEQQEIDCIHLVRERTNVPVPAVYGYNVHPDNAVGASFMLMECLPGNTAMNIDPDIPPRHRVSFFADMARFQTAISSIQFPKIGSIIRLQDGTYDIGPIPKLGGPFNTATECLTALADNVKFGCPIEGMRAICGDSSDEIAAHIRDFTVRLKSLAASIPTRNHGAFPLCHIDFGHHNVIVDDDYNALGAIDWEHACTLPWEVVDFPMTLSITLAPMAAPTLYDKKVVPKDATVRETIIDRK
ncbi:hypothetical protein N7G274_004194 [Stereocaulon virgatum]|uniref:Aminoglycoside phosphotransferase domain-containing protein n=1 Tax=Stereocaulon virgatum TaxID=373712 RepID=A0ABR4ACC8_9LECA